MALITAQQVIDECINNVNFDPSLIKDSYILAAEYEFIKPFLGIDFYDALVLSPLTYSDLTEYLYKALKWYTLYKSLPFIHLHLGSQGIMINNVNYAQQASSKQRGEIASMAISIGDTYLREAKVHIINNIEDYPLFNCSDSKRFLGGIIL
jgi:hypothetical protein